MVDKNDAEVRTRSVPVAAMLIANGYELLRTTVAPWGAKTYFFSPAARDVVARYFEAKDQLDAAEDRESRRA